MDHLDTGAVGGIVMVCQLDVLADRISEWQTRNTRVLGYVFAAVELVVANCNAAHLQVAQESIQDCRDPLQVAEGSV